MFSALLGASEFVPSETDFVGKSLS